MHFSLININTTCFNTSEPELRPLDFPPTTHFPLAAGAADPDRVTEAVAVLDIILARGRVTADTVGHVQGTGVEAKVAEIDARGRGRGPDARAVARRAGRKLPRLRGLPRVPVRGATARAARSRGRS